MTRYIDSHRGRFGVQPICDALGWNVSTYYAHTKRPPSNRALRDAWLLGEIRRVHAANWGVYGADKVWRQLRREGIEVARCTVERLMAADGLHGARRGRPVRTTTPDTTAARPPDLLDRDFTAARPNQRWVADITYVRTWAGFVHVAFVIDVFSRMIVGWSLATHLRTDLPLDALEMAIWRRKTRLDGLVHHSDAGRQGGFKRSSQHLVIVEVLDGTTSAAGGSGSAAGDALAGQADGGAACGAHVLAADRAGQAH
jgi:hypothetical protein